MAFVTKEKIPGSESIEMAELSFMLPACLCKLAQKAMLKDVLLPTANLGFYHIYFCSFNRHVMGPESCLNINFIS